MRCYLSGPITGKTFGQASDWRDRVSAELTEAGFEVRNPLRGKCVSLETRLLKADLTWMPAKYIEVGDELVAFDENTSGKTGANRRLRRATVIDAALVTLPSAEITLASGTKIICANDHLWLASQLSGHNRRWMATKDLMMTNRPNSRGTALLKLFEPWDVDDSRDAGYLAGMFDGEGCVGNGVSCGVGQSAANLDLLLTCEQLLIERGFVLSYSSKISSSGQRAFGFNIRGAMTEQMRFVGTIRPARMGRNLRWEDHPWGTRRTVVTRNRASQWEQHGVVSVKTNEKHRELEDKVIAVRPLGDQLLKLITTTEGTYFAEGYASHNSYLSHQKTPLDSHKYQAKRNPTLSDKALKKRDVIDVVSSDIILVNFEDAERVSVGSVYEIAVADFLNKLIVMVVPAGAHPHDHAFLRDAAVIFNDLESAVNYILSCGVEDIERDH